MDEDGITVREDETESMTPEDKMIRIVIFLALIFILIYYASLKLTRPACVIFYTDWD